MPPHVARTYTATGDLLALAGDLADILDIRTPIPTVTDFAARKGSSAVVKAAKRLDAILASPSRS